MRGGLIPKSSASLALVIQGIKLPTTIREAFGMELPM